jgi:hypothetical protein
MYELNVRQTLTSYLHLCSGGAETNQPGHRRRGVGSRAVEDGGDNWRGEPERGKYGVGLRLLIVEPGAIHRF